MLFTIFEMSHDFYFKKFAIFILQIIFLNKNIKKCMQYVEGSFKILIMHA